MEKKIRVKRLTHQDDVKRSWTAAYPFREDFESILPEEIQEAQSKLDAVENTSPDEIQPSVTRQDTDVSAQ